MQNTSQDEISNHVDVLVVGGGVNGAGIAADAAGRGLSVLVCEQADLASATSSASSKLIHGGLRYLEHYEFGLVRKALKEREVLLNVAPHIVTPMRFRLPHLPNLRPAWMIRAGLFLYDNLAKRETLPGSKSIKFGVDSPLVSSVTKGFEYSDCWVDDARMVVLNAIAVREHGGQVLTRTQCVRAVQENGEWQVTLKNTFDGSEQKVTAKVLINAAGPWAQRFIEDSLSKPSSHQVRLVRGSHIVVDRLFEGEESYILQIDDGRIVFAIPYLDRFTLFGTTDIEHTGEADNVEISEKETDYLIDVCNSYFKTKIDREDIRYTYSGVRPLLEDESDDPSKVTRDYKLELSHKYGAPLLSVFGGKLTTYRTLSEEVVNMLEPLFPAMKAPWTDVLPLPGGNFDSQEQLQRDLLQRFPFLPESLVHRFVNAYGTLSMEILKGADSITSLGTHFGGDLYQAEVDYLVNREWVMTAEDLLFRRSKLGLTLPPEACQAVEHYLMETQQQKAS